MASSQEQQESAHTSPTSTTAPDGTGSLSTVGEEPISTTAENSISQPIQRTPGSPVPGLRSGQEELFSQDESEVPAPTWLPSASVTAGEAAGESGESQSHSHGAGRASNSREATPRAAETGEDTGIPGLPSRFPSPPSVSRATPPGFHPGPATSSSLSSYRPPLNPEAQPFAPRNLARPRTLAEMLLDRGLPPGTRDPMQMPHGPAAGEVAVTPAQAARYRASAARHAAMVFKRLMDADSNIHANTVDREFERIFGQENRDTYVRLIADPPESTEGSNDDNGFY